MAKTLKTKKCQSPVHSVKFRCHLFDRAKSTSDVSAAWAGHDSFPRPWAALPLRSVRTRSSRISRLRATSSSVAFHFTVTSYIRFFTFIRTTITHSQNTTETGPRPRPGLSHHYWEDLRWRRVNLSRILHDEAQKSQAPKRRQWSSCFWGRNLRILRETWLNTLT